MLAIRIFAWGALAAAFGLVWFAIQMHLWEPAIWGALATVSGVACLAIDLALTRLTEIRDAVLSVRAILAPNDNARAADSGIPNNTGPI